MHLLWIGIWWGTSSRMDAASAGSTGRTIEVRLWQDRLAADSDASDASPAVRSTKTGTTTDVDKGEPDKEEPGTPAAVAQQAETVRQAPPVPQLPPQEMPYIAAAELESRPQPESPVIVPFPDALLGKPKASGVLVLYIGADGKIDRIEVERSDLPPAFEKAAVDTFMAARMQPGVKDGKASRARMKVLVEFEAR